MFGSVDITGLWVRYTFIIISRLRDVSLHSNSPHVVYCNNIIILSLYNCCIYFKHIFTSVSLLLILLNYASAEREELFGNICYENISPGVWCGKRVVCVNVKTYVWPPGIAIPSISYMISPANMHLLYLQQLSGRSSSDGNTFVFFH